jgi:hypothetical protein
MSSVVYDHSELVSRCSAMFSLMNVAEKNSFLQANGLVRVSDADGVFSGSNHLILSPAQDKSKCRNRAGEALRIISDGAAPTPRDPKEKVVRLTDADMKEWFDQIGSGKTGRIGRNDFCELYQRLEWFGGPSRLPWVNSQLDILCGQTDFIDFEKFAYLVSHLSPL